jgi:hypothetical protein
MSANINPGTNLPYGIIQASKLDPEVLDTLLYQAGKDLSFLSYIEDNPDDEDGSGYHCDEPVIEGVYEGVTYRTSWVGALHVFIFHSPTLWQCRPCSLCVPNAGNLDQLGQGDYEAYGVPLDWLDGEFIDQLAERLSPDDPLKTLPAIQAHLQIWPHTRPFCGACSTFTTGLSLIAGRYTCTSSPKSASSMRMS